VPKSGLHLHSLLSTNPLKSSPSRGPNHPEFARNAANQNPGASRVAGTGGEIRSPRRQEFRRERGAQVRPRRRLGLRRPGGAPEQASEPGRPQPPTAARGGRQAGTNLQLEGKRRGKWESGGG
jgi:hypothetical protein